jgi:hypothetical protein
MVDIRKQPVKSIFIVYYILSALLVRIPLWTIIGLIPALRPRRSWTVSRVVIVRLYEYAIFVQSR